MFGLSQRYPDTVSLPVIVDVQRLHEMVDKLYVFLTGLNSLAFVYELTGCGFDSCYCHLNFRYCV